MRCWPNGRVNCLVFTTTVGTAVDAQNVVDQHFKRELSRVFAPVACRGVIGEILARLDLGNAESCIRTSENPTSRHLGE